MLAPLVLTLSLAGQAPAIPGPEPLVRTEALERIPLPRGALARVEVDALAGQVRLHGAAAALRAATRGSELCPEALPAPFGLVLQCRSRRLEAQVARGALVLRTLLGVPAAEGESRLPGFVYAPEAVGLDGSCVEPTTAAARAECALAAGDKGAARLALEQALTEGNRDYALVRMADLALAEGDLEVAFGLLKGVSRSGPWMRLAHARRCELEGSCFRHGVYSQGFDPLDTAALSRPFRREMTLRRARVLAFYERFDDALALVVEEPWVCGGAEVLCKRLVLEAARQPGSDSLLVVAAYASLPAEPRIRDEVELAQRVARRSHAEGGSAFAAGVLARVSDLVPPSALEAHLEETAQRFVDADDELRARVVMEFAASRFGGSAEARLKRLKKKQEPQLDPQRIGLKERNRAREAASRVRRKLYGEEADSTASVTPERQ